MTERKAHTFAPRGTGHYRVSKVTSAQTVELDHMDGIPAFADPIPVSELTDRRKGENLKLGDPAERDEGSHPPNRAWEHLSNGSYVAYIMGSKQVKEVSIGKVTENICDQRRVTVHDSNVKPIIFYTTIMLKILTENYPALISNSPHF